MYDIQNTSKHTENLNIHYSPILHLLMNTRNGRAKFKNFLILLDSGSSYTIASKRIITKT